MRAGEKAVSMDRTFVIAFFVWAVPHVTVNSWLILANVDKPSEQREQGPWKCNSNYSRRRKSCRPDEQQKMLCKRS